MRNPRIAAKLCLALALLTQFAVAESSKAAKPPKANRLQLTQNIDKIIGEPDVSRGFWGIEVVSLKDGSVLYSMNSDKLFTPASNTKLYPKAHQRIVTKPARPKHCAMTERTFLVRTRPP